MTVIHSVSIEKICHYRCGRCMRWWSVADAPVAMAATCPHCATEATVVPAANPEMEVIHLPVAFDLIAHLHRQREWSERTFGPGARAEGVVDHICKELAEILHKPDDLSEWIDVVILALDGAWRAGYSAEQIVSALVAKQAKNEQRQWPDWRSAEPGKAIEHVREERP